VNKTRHYVYKITNKINGKFYIGIKSSRLNFLDTNYYGSGRLIKASIKKHGKENFLREVLFEFRTREEVLSKEKELVTKDLVSSHNCYNITVGGGGFTNLNYRSLPIKSLDFMGKITYYKSMLDASLLVKGCNRTGVRNAIIGKANTHNNLYWSKADKDFLIKKNRNSITPCFSLDENSSKIYYNSFSEASKATGVACSIIRRCVVSGKGTGGGFNWYKTTSKLDSSSFRGKNYLTRKPCISIDKTGAKKYYSSITEASKQTGICNTNICLCLKLKARSAGGLSWYYTDSETNKFNGVGPRTKCYESTDSRGNKKRYKSLKEAAKSNNYSVDYISKAAKNNLLVAGLKWERINAK